MRRLLAAGLLLCASGLPAFHVGPVSLLLTVDSLLQNNGAADRSGQFYQTLSLAGRYRGWQAGATLRLRNFDKQAANWTFARGRFDLYKKFLQYQGRHFQAQAGDFHALLGRGLALSVLPNDKLLRERTILGGDLRFEAGRLTLRALAGNVREEASSRDWRLAGAELLWRHRPGLRLGAHASAVSDRGYAGGDPGRLTGSLSLAGELGAGFEYYAESAALAFSRSGAGGGHGGFASLTWRSGRWTVMAEAKRYLRFDNGLNNPPPADREDELSPLADAAGGRLYMQYALPDPDLMFFFSAGSLAESGRRGSHFYGGMALQDLGERLSLSAAFGWRTVAERVTRIDADLLYLLGRDLSLELTWRQKSFGGGPGRFCERDLLAQVAFGRRGSLFGQYQYSAQPVLDRRHFFCGGGRWNVGAGAYLEATAGAIRGGEVCAAGQCVVLPPFSGVKLAFFAVLR